MAIAPFNYANPQATAVGTGSAKIAPFTYATPTVATPQKPSIASVAGNSLVGGVKQIGGVFKDDASQILDAFKSSFNLGVQSVDKITDPKGGTPYEGLQAGLGLEEGVGGVAFSWLSPITNQVSALIQNAGKAMVNAPRLDPNVPTAFESYGKDLVHVPEAQSQNDTTSKILNTAAGFGNVAMAILGAKGLGAEVPRVETPTKLNVAHAEPTGNLPLQPTNPELPTIQMGPKSDSTLPTIQTLPKASNVKGDITYEPVKAPVSSETAPTFAEKPVTPNKTGEITKVASDINQTLVRQGFDSLPAEEQSKYTPQSYKEQANSIASMMDSNLDEVKAIASGEKPVPKNLNGQILFNAVEALATKEGDGELLTKLAKSPLGKKLSEAGQALGGHGFNDNPHSVIAAIQEIQRARAPKAAGVPKEVEAIKSTIRKTNTKETWGSFIKTLEC